jgi:hypothetical protein
MPKANDVLFAVVGAGDFAVEKARSVGKLAHRESTSRLYEEFV